MSIIIAVLVGLFTAIVGQVIYNHFRKDAAAREAIQYVLLIVGLVASISWGAVIIHLFVHHQATLG